jgi:transposase-like protein
MKNKKNYSIEEKIIILREHLEKNVPVGELAEKYGIYPNAYYKWQKQLFEEAPQILARKHRKEDERKISAQERENTELKAVLAKRENLISELVADNFELKKKYDGMGLPKNGSNRK